MNALELAEECQDGYPSTRDAIAAAKMLRRQHEAIVKLREAIQNLTDHSTALSLNQINDWVMLRKALKDTEGLQ